MDFRRWKSRWVARNTDRQVARFSIDVNVNWQVSVRWISDQKTEFPSEQSRL
jgi:hypothetical protein